MGFVRFQCSAAIPDEVLDIDGVAWLSSHNKVIIRYPGTCGTQ